MTYEDFKDMCYTIRNDGIEKKRLNAILEKLKKESPVTVSVTDPTQDRIQSHKSPDEKTIDEILTHDRKVKTLQKKINELSRVNPEVYDLLESGHGIAGQIIVMFFLYGERMETITNELFINRQYGYELMNKELKRLFNTRLTKAG